MSAGNRGASWQELCAAIDDLVGKLERAGGDGAAGPLLEVLVPSSVAAVARAFHLSGFERDLLWLCVARELDSRVSDRYAALGRGPHVTFGAALALLPEAHWSALSPHAPLRRHLFLTTVADDTLVNARLVVDERIVHHVAGVPALDARIAPYLTPMSSTGQVPSKRHEVARARIRELLRRSQRAVLSLVGSSPSARADVARMVCAAERLPLFRVTPGDLPAMPGDRETVVRLWNREVALIGAVALIEVDVGELPETLRQLHAFVEGAAGPVFISSRERLPLERLDARAIAIPDMTASETLTEWTHALGDAVPRLSTHVERLADQFRLDPAAVSAICDDVDFDGEPDDVAAALWNEARLRTRESLDQHARRITPTATWADLILPPPVLAALQGLADRVSFRYQVHERWGFAGPTARGRGIAALFSGSSGTGKTLAAEAIASEAHLDLIHVDLSQVVDKYIGQTEKHLARIFDAAEAGGAILLFDEADALFGKRGEIEKASDRYANLEVSYLLQRMEQYRGLAILTTNAKDAIDNAFLRRLSVVVNFPFPDVAHRRKLWERSFPADAPIDALDFDRLARLQLAGGDIRNVAMNAAFLAAREGGALAMPHLLRAARAEFTKLERAFPEAEIARPLTTGR